MRVGQTWEEAWQTGRSAWPALVVSLSELMAHVGAPGLDLDLGDGGAPEGLHAADLYVACAIARGVPGALAVFEQKLLPIARSSMARVYSAPDFLDDASQELSRKLLVGDDARLRRYSGASPLEGWLRVTATRVALDLARASGYRAQGGGLDESAMMAAGDALAPEIDVLKRTLGPAFQTALQGALDAMSPRDRLLLRMQLVDGLSLDQIAQPYRVHRATAARWLAEIREQILRGVQERLLVGAGARPLRREDLESLGRLIASQLHISVARLDPRPA